jgi:dipeptidyl aminopeptidase/acylaminoacyl peptidase
MLYLLRAALLAQIVAIVSFAQAQPVPLIPLENFAKLPSVSGLTLSPDGEYIAFRSEVNGRVNLVVRPRLGGKMVVIPPIKDAEISWFAWAKKDRLAVSYRLYTLSRNVGEKIQFTRLTFVSPDGSNFKLAYNSYGEIDYTQIQDSVIHWLPNDPEHILLEADSNGDQSDGYEVLKLNVYNGKSTGFHASSMPVFDWRADKGGAVRLGLGYRNVASSREKPFVTYLDPDTQKWIKLDESKLLDNYQLVGFTEDPRFAYVTGRGSTDRAALLKFDLRANKAVETIFEDTKYDVDRPIFDPVTRQLTGVQVTRDYTHFHYFDPLWKRRQAAIDKALPGTQNDIYSQSNDGRIQIIRQSDDRNSGAFYALDVAKKQMDQIALTSGQYAPEMMADKQPIAFKARDGLDISGYLTLPKNAPLQPLPMVVYVHGGAWSRDTQHFDETVQFLANRGYAVLQPNFRGSSGFGKKFSDLSERNWGKAMQDDETDAAQWAIAQGHADPKRICIMGGSYSGYAALFGAVKTPDLFKCSISINGVADVPQLLKDDRNVIGGNSWIVNIRGKENEKIDLPEILISLKYRRIRMPRR